jgi:hypothetical protein
MNAPLLQSIERLLVAGSLDPAEAKMRAPTVLEAFEWIGFDLLKLHGRANPYAEPFCIPEYFFGRTGFSVDNAEGAKTIKPEWIGGTGMDRGHLQLFSRVSMIARELLPGIWLKSRNLRQCLRDAEQHLNTVEEICWLDRWINPRNIALAKSLRPDAGTDVDWQFQLGEVDQNPICINLEVKRLVGDVVRHLRGRTFKIEWFEKFCRQSVIPKFRPSDDDEVNVLALTLFGEISREVQLVIAQWLTERQSMVDAVLVTSREARRRSCFDWHFRNDKASRLKSFLKSPSAEEKSWIFELLVPIDIPGIPSIVRK